MSNMLDFDPWNEDTTGYPQESKPAWAESTPLTVHTLNDVWNFQSDSFETGVIQARDIPWIRQKHALYASFAAFVGNPLTFEDQVRQVFQRGVPQVAGGHAWKQFFNSTKAKTQSPTPKEQVVAAKVLTIWEDIARTNAEEKKNAFSSAASFAKRMDIDMDLEPDKLPKSNKLPTNTLPMPHPAPQPQQPRRSNKIPRRSVPLAEVETVEAEELVSQALSDLTGDRPDLGQLQETVEKLDKGMDNVLSVLSNLKTGTATEQSQQAQLTAFTTMSRHLMASFGTMLGPEDEGGLEPTQLPAIIRAIMPAINSAIQMGKQTFNWNKEEMLSFFAPLMESGGMPKLKEKIDNAYAASTSTTAP